MLVELGNRIVNTDHIVGAEPVDARGRYGWRLTLTRADAVTIQDGPSELDWLCGAIVPASLGFVLVEAFLPGLVEGEEAIVYRESTILAFRVAPGPKPPAPITIEGEAVAHEDLLLAVVDPNGRCVSAATPYERVAEFEAMCEHRGAKRRVHAAQDDTGEGPVQSPRAYTAPDISNLSMLDRLGMPADAMPTAKKNRSKVDFYLPWPPGHASSQPENDAQQCRVVPTTARSSAASPPPASPEQLAASILALVSSIERHDPGAPAAIAFRAALRRKGQDLADAGGSAALADVLARVRADAPDRADAREAVLTAAWADLSGWRI